MADTNTVEYAKVVLTDIPISEEQCIGDSLPIINNALLSLSDGINKLNGLFGTITNCETTTNRVTATGEFLTVNVNGVPRKIRLWD